MNSSPSRVRDAVLALAKQQDAAVALVTSFPIGSGTLFTLRPSDERHIDAIATSIERSWPFCQVSHKMSDLDGTTGVSILVPSRSEAWSLAKATGRRWWLSVVIGVLKRGTLASAFVVFVVSFLERLKRAEETE